jgi:hypothetical protein
VFDADNDGAPDPVPGWPVSLNYQGKSLSAPAIGDVDGDLYPEVVFTTQHGVVHVIDGRGYEENGWPVTGLSTWTYTTPALANIFTEPTIRPRLEIVVADQTMYDQNHNFVRHGNVYMFNYNGTLRPGFPVTLSSGISSSPVLGDLDRDSQYEIVQACRDGRIYALERTGAEMAGWTGGLTFSADNGDLLPSPALANVVGDARPEVFMGTRHGLAGWLPDGTPMAGWPLTLASNMGTESSPVVADLNGDGDFEILIGGFDHLLHVVNESGDRVQYWPAPTTAGITATPTVADLDGNGTLEVIVVSDYDLYVWGGMAGGQIRWGTFHHSNLREGRYPIPMYPLDPNERTER